jgi:hypothetical protein
MKKQTRKLNLNRETLAPLQRDELANVNGGESLPLTSTASLPPTNTITTTIMSWTRACV